MPRPSLHHLKAKYLQKLTGRNPSPEAAFFRTSSSPSQNKATITRQGEVADAVAQTAPSSNTSTVETVLPRTVAIEEKGQLPDALTATQDLTEVKGEHIAWKDGDMSGGQVGI